MSIQSLITNKRQFSRIDFDAPVTLANKDNNWKSKLLDISLKGALIEKPANWSGENGTQYKLFIQLPHSDIHIDMEVELAHVEDERIGFHCLHIDLDSVTSLRRLVELNLGDENLLEREIANMLE